MAGGTQRKTVVAGNGVLFEVVFKNAEPSKKPAHGISLSYGGQVYRCSDAASIGSVHTIHTEDEDDEDDCLRNSRGHGKDLDQASPQKLLSSACLKKSPRGSILRSRLSPKPSPKKLRRSRTLSPSHQSRTRSILAPFSNFSQKLSFRRHSYDEDAKTKQNKPQVRQEATKPVIGPRPIVQNIPFGCQQAPPPFVYQKQFPMYHYVPAPHSQPVFGAPPTAYPMAHGAPSGGTAPQCPPALQQLQDHINHLTSIVAANPIDLLAKQELGQLLAERNAFLDSATKKTATTVNPSRVETMKPKEDGVRLIATKKPILDDSGSDELQENSAASIGSSKSSVAPEQHHICSGCGEQRSPSFHRKHPFAKPVHNVCRKCRDGKRASSVMNRYHFCDSCGIVRSKEYHHRRGNATSVSGRSKICRKCHLNGNHVRESTNKAPRDYKDLSKDGKRKEIVTSKSVAHTASALPRESIKIEPRARSRQSQRQRNSLANTDVLGHDGISDLGQSTRSTTQPETLYNTVKEESFKSYRPPQIRDEDASSNPPVTLESSFHSSSTESFNFQERTVPTAHSPEFPLFDTACESSEASLPSLCASSHNITSNPYYQPRSTAARPCSPFRPAEAPPPPPSPPPRRPPPPAHHLPPRTSYPPPFEMRSGSSFPDFPDVSGKPRFVDRNQSWPGDMHVPSPSDFSYVSGTGRKVSASDGAQSPQPIPPIYDSARPWTRADAGERFTTGAFGKPPPPTSSFQTSTSPPASPWASFSGPIPQPAADESGGGGSRGAVSHDGSSHAGARKASAFGGCYYRNSSPEPASPDEPPRGFPFRFEKPRSYSRRGGGVRDEFKSTRGAWNVNTGNSAFARRGRGHEDVPEPIIEEPSSPVAKSPLTTPLLLEFHGETSDSGVELLTDSSDSFSASSSSSSSQESLLASHLGDFSVHHL
ncbi:hypothetical protein BM221_008317 [Beauveria bassiana]|uniref:Uncharacterized protein n=1 Tax=Beauveria bassiana TaxID=176275 RepID=A0A2N6NFP5_BEABA|nr:hypothetical protein BM221_008317 [Beauveria bassiana]